MSTFIGSTLSIVAGAPATEDPVGYEALSLVEIGKIVSIGELGDKSDETTFDLLKDGRRSRFNGVKDVGNVPVTYIYERGDAGQTIVEAGNNTNTVHTFAIVDADGDAKYFQGLIANLAEPERTASTNKGASFEMRAQTGITTVKGS
jgi:hypothetical protein